MNCVTEDILLDLCRPIPLVKDMYYGPVADECDVVHQQTDVNVCDPIDSLLTEEAGL